MARGRLIMLSRIQRKLDAAAIEQLRAEVTRLYEENESLRSELSFTTDCLDMWEDHARNLEDLNNTKTGITKCGKLKVL
jgi:hypothetical protein